MRDKQVQETKQKTETVIATKQFAEKVLTYQQNELVITPLIHTHAYVKLHKHKWGIHSL